MSEHTPFSIKRDLKGNPQLARYGGLTVMASFHPAGFASDEEMERVAAELVVAGNSHAALVAACKTLLDAYNEQVTPSPMEWRAIEAALHLAGAA